MSWFGSSSLHIGIERTIKGFRIAILKKKWQGWQIVRLEEIPSQECVKLLDTLPSNPVVASALLSREELIRSIDLPLKRQKTILQALPFQIEPHLPYPLEKCVIQPLSFEKKKEGTGITICSIKKESFQAHLEGWQRIGVQPDYVTSTSYALAKLTLLFSLPQVPFILLHFTDDEGTCALIEQGKVLMARPVKKDTQDIQKVLLSLSSGTKHKKIDHLLALGQIEEIQQWLKNHSGKEIMTPKSPLVDQAKLQLYSLPIGLALASGDDQAANFRTGLFSPPKPWKKIQRPLYGLLLSLFLLFTSTFGLTQLLLHKEKIKIQQAFSAFVAVEGGEASTLPVSLQEVSKRLGTIDKEIRSRPDTFPLFPGIPKVSDVLAWLSNHPALNTSDKSLEIYIDRFHYILEKRPSFNERSTHYQGKVELDLSTSNPAAARAFHEALLSANPFVDGKKEIHWSSSRGKFFTSFYLKDKTRYQ